MALCAIFLWSSGGHQCSPEDHEFIFNYNFIAVCSTENENKSLIENENKSLIEITGDLLLRFCSLEITCQEQYVLKSKAQHSQTEATVSQLKMTKATTKTKITAYMSLILCLVEQVCIKLKGIYVFQICSFQ